MLFLSQQRCRGVTSFGFEHLDHISFFSSTASQQTSDPSTVSLAFTWWLSWISKERPAALFQPAVDSAPPLVLK
jgi:hypothetical protein